MKKNGKNQFVYVLTCVDPANIDTLVKIFNHRFGKGNYFMPGELGGVKVLVDPAKKTDREFVLNKIKTSDRVHKIDLILLVNHSGCGAYRLAGHVFENKDEEESFHAGEMKKASTLLQKKFPDTKLETGYFLKKEQKMTW
ncbi:MAG: hypothetical protein Q8R29_02530 [bacterium]|nr:hypothetical protein [bacterium]